MERWRVELAAHCGYVAARSALRVSQPARLTLRGWIDGIARFGQEPLVRAALAAARFVHPIWIEGVFAEQVRRSDSLDEESTGFSASTKVHEGREEEVSLGDPTHDEAGAGPGVLVDEQQPEAATPEHRRR